MSYFDTIPGAERLADALLALRDKAECHAFLEDICTIKEMQENAQRLEVAFMLDEGKNYQEISKATGASTATISRVKKCLVYGSGGYQTAIARAKEGGSNRD